MISVYTAQTALQKEAAWRVVVDVYPNMESIIPNHVAYRDKVLSKAQIICAESDGKLVGMVAFYCNDLESKTAYITQIAVKKNAQGAGIGGLLMRKCEEVSRQNGMVYLRLEVRNDNLNAIKFYQKHDLQYEKSASEKSIYMMKSLYGTLFIR